MITQELRKVMEKVSCDINKITQACTAAQENSGSFNRECYLTGFN